MCPWWVVRKDKTRDMARSVLPSTMREYARKAKRTFRKKVRKYAKNALRQLDYGNEPRPHFDLRVDQKFDKFWGIRSIVGNRREADKVVPLRKWFAVKVAEIAEPDARKAYANAILGNDLIGWHAKSHLYDIIENGEPRPRYKPLRKVHKREKVQEKLEAIIRHEDGGKLAALNKRLRTQSVIHKRVVGVDTEPFIGFGGMTRARSTYRFEVIPGDPPAPQLRGLGDIQEFMDKLYEGFYAKEGTGVFYEVSTPHKSYDPGRFELPNVLYHPEWLNCVLQFE